MKANKANMAKSNYQIIKKSKTLIISKKERIKRNFMNEITHFKWKKKIKEKCLKIIL